MGVVHTLVFYATVDSHHLRSHVCILSGSKNNLFLDSSDTYASEPRFSSAGDETGALTISHREYITDIYGNSLDGGVPIPFVNKSFEINPGIEASFPWLSQVAQNFEEYSIKQLVYTYKSTIQDVNSANGQVGSVVTATQYNPSRPDFTNKMVMMEYAHAHTTKAVDTNIHGVEADPAKNSGPEGKYVRAGDVPINEDIKTYDLGKFQLAVCGTPTVLADLPIGELWVDYTIELRKPKLFTGQGLGISRYVVKNSAFNVSASNQLHPLGNTASSDNYPVVDCSNNLDIAVVSDATSGTILTLPDSLAGYFEIRISMRVTTDPSTGAYDWFRLRAPELLGNIEDAFDMDASGGTEIISSPPPAAGTDPVAIINPPVMSGGNSQTVALLMVCHIKVEPATGGSKNQLSWGTNSTGAWNSYKRGETMVWNASEVAYTTWSAAAGGAGVTMSAGDIDGCQVTISEYNSPIAHGVSIPQYKNLQGVLQ